MSLSLVHLTHSPTAPSAARPPLLLLLHGVGSHEGDLIQLAPYLDPRAFIVSARAPVVLGPGMYGWFHVQLDPNLPIINPQEAESSRQILLRFIDEAVAKYDTDPERVYLMGFSQGAIIGFSVALTRPEQVAGLIAMSGRILPEVQPLIAPLDQLRGLPIFIAHGTEDAVLPIHHGRGARALLSELPVSLTYREYSMGHQVSAESLADITAWLTARLDGPRRIMPQPESGRDLR